MPFLSLSASDFEPQHRIPAFQEAAATICRLEVLPEDPGSFTSTTAIAVLPEAIIASTVHSQCTTLRTTAIAEDEHDNILLHVPMQAGFAITQRGGNDAECAAGSLYIDPNEVPGVAHFTDASTNVLYISLPRHALAGSRGAVDRLLRTSARMSPHWQLFVGYARQLHDCFPALNADQARLCTAHLHDLARMALAEGQLVEEAGEGRGVRAAWLEKLKADIERHLTSPELSLNGLAVRHGISTRYIRALFASDRTTFRDYVKDRRLSLAHRLLTDQRHTHRSISDIAMSAGFGDLSWFNACYRQTYGRTPSDTRAIHRAHPRA